MNPCDVETRRTRSFSVAVNRALPRSPLTPEQARLAALEADISTYERAAAERERELIAGSLDGRPRTPGEAARDHQVAGLRQSAAARRAEAREVWAALQLAPPPLAADEPAPAVPVIKRRRRWRR